MKNNVIVRTITLVMYSTRSTIILLRSRVRLLKKYSYWSMSTEYDYSISDLNIDFLFEWKITKGQVVVFDNWSVFEKYLQIQSNTYKKLPTNNR